MTTTELNKVFFTFFMHGERDEGLDRLSTEGVRQMRAAFQRQMQRTPHPISPQPSLRPPWWLSRAARKD